MSQGRLPLYRVVFVDWHGVLSEDPFWSSVLGGSDGKLRRALGGRLAEVFESELASTWMRGEASVDRIVAPVSGTLGRRRDDFLQRRLLDDCLKMRVDAPLACCLQGVVRRAFLVLATDNTDDFESAFHRARVRPLPSDSPQTFRELAPIFDDIVCSSATGVFKAEDPETFFGSWLDANGLGFEDALLIDDRHDNCAAFERCGGSAVPWSAAATDRARAMRRVRDFTEPAVQSLGLASGL